MKALFIILGVLILLVVLLWLLRLRVCVEYGEGGASVTLFLGPAPFLKVPAEHKTGEEKPSGGKEGKKKKKRKKKETEGKTKGGSIPGFRDLLQIITDVLGKLKRRLTVDELTLWYQSGSDDPAAAALGYGRANAAAGALLQPLTELFRIRETDVRTAVDFMETKPRVYARLLISISAAALIRIALRALRLFLRARRKARRKNTEGST